MANDAGAANRSLDRPAMTAPDSGAGCLGRRQESRGRRPAQLRTFRVLATKDSGPSGGVPEKLAAAFSSVAELLQALRQAAPTMAPDYRDGGE